MLFSTFPCLGASNLFTVPLVFQVSDHTSLYPLPYSDQTMVHYFNYTAVYRSRILDSLSFHLCYLVKFQPWINAASYFLHNGTLIGELLETHIQLRGLVLPKFMFSNVTWSSMLPVFLLMHLFSFPLSPMGPISNLH